VSFNFLDWQLYCGGALLQSAWRMDLDGPQPALASGALPAGRTVSGYVVWEVPAGGDVRIAYAPPQGIDSGFEVVIRPS